MNKTTSVFTQYPQKKHINKNPHQNPTTVTTTVTKLPAFFCSSKVGLLAREVMALLATPETRPALEAPGRAEPGTRTRSGPGTTSTSTSGAVQAIFVVGFLTKKTWRMTPWRWWVWKNLKDRVVGGITNYLLSGMILKNSWKLVNLVHLFPEQKSGWGIPGIKLDKVP